MAKGIYMTVDGVVRNAPSAYMTVDNTLRSVPAGYMTVDGAVRQFHPAGTPLGDIGVMLGDSFYLNVDGVATEFIVINYGQLINNDTEGYYVEDDGIWLLMKNIWKVDYYHTSNVYSHRMSSVLNDEFLPLLDKDVQSVIKTVKIPYYNGPSVSSSSGGELCYGWDGLDQKIFLLSLHECGIYVSSTSTNGDALSSRTCKTQYFSSNYNGATNADRIAYYNGTAIEWWTRSPRWQQSSYELVINTSGSYTSKVTNTTNKYGIRPALVLPYTALVNENRLVVG